MNLYRRARKHFDMNRIKELKQEKEIEVKKEFLYTAPTPELSNWRNDIES